MTISFCHDEEPQVSKTGPHVRHGQKAGGEVGNRRLKLAGKALGRNGGKRRLSEDTNMRVHGFISSAAHQKNSFSMFNCS